MSNTSSADTTRESPLPKEPGLLNLVAAWAFVSLLGGMLGGLTSSLILHESISDDPPVEEPPSPPEARTYRAFDECRPGLGVAQTDVCFLAETPMFRRPLQHHWMAP